MSSSSTFICDSHDFDVNCISYGKPKINQSGGKNIPTFNNNMKCPIRLKFPYMLTWGAHDDMEQKNRWSFSLQYPQEDIEKTEEIKKSLAKMIEFEEKIKSDAIVHAADWLDQDGDTSAAVINALWSPMLKYTKIKGTKKADKSKQPCLDVKLPQWENVWKFEIYTPSGRLLFPVNSPGEHPEQFIKKFSVVSTAVVNGGVWVTGGKFGTTWKLIQLMIQKEKPSFQGKCLFTNIVPDDDDEEDDLESYKHDVPFIENSSTSVINAEENDSAFVEDTDDEVGEEETNTGNRTPSPVVVQEPTTVAPKKKKAAGKK